MKNTSLFGSFGVSVKALIMCFALAMFGSAYAGDSAVVKGSTYFDVNAPVVQGTDDSYMDNTMPSSTYFDVDTPQVQGTDDSYVSSYNDYSDFYMTNATFIDAGTFDPAVLKAKNEAYNEFYNDYSDFYMTNATFIDSAKL